MRLTYGDLPEEPEHNVFLHCWCGEYSARRGDYYNIPDDQEIGVCEECDAPIQLVRERMTLETIKE